MMHDMEKIFKGMEMCISPDECSPDDCPYYDRPRNESGLCWDRLMTDALELLKEQKVAYQGAVELLRQKTILFDDAIKRLKEQEEEIRQLRLALDIAKGTCKGIKVEGR